MIKSSDAIRIARSMIGTPYSKCDCINLIKWVILQAPGGVPGYTTAGTNTLWRSYDSNAKYRDLIWRQEGISGAQAGMLAFKRTGDDVHHVGLVTGDGTVIHSSSVNGRGVVETALDKSWSLLAIHRYIESKEEKGDPIMENALYQAAVHTMSTDLNLRDAPDGNKIGSLPFGGTVDMLDDSNASWWRVRYEGQEGYASAAYLVPVKYADAVTVVPDAVNVTEDATTLVRDDGMQITLSGKWRVAED